MKIITIPFWLLLFFIFAPLYGSIVISYKSAEIGRMKADFAEQKVYYEETIKRLESENQKLKDSQLIVPRIVASIALHETNMGRAGVGRTKNNPLSVKCGQTYCTYPSLLEGYRAGVRLWNARYAGLPVEHALARWKTGDSSNRDPETLRYISNITSKI